MLHYWNKKYLQKCLRLYGIIYNTSEFIPIRQYISVYIQLRHTSIALYICDRVHRYARWNGRLSHQSSNLSHPCNLLQKIVIHALLNTRFKGMQVVTYLTNCQTTEVILTKKFPGKGLCTCTWINKVHSSSWLYMPMYWVGPIHRHTQTTGYSIENNNFNIIGREDWG